MTGPWTWQGAVQPAAGTTLGDHNLFYDNVDDGTGNSRNKAYMLYAGGANQYTYQLDPATDWTSLTGSSITLGLSSYEGLVLFKYNGVYYELGLQSTAYGSGDCLVRYSTNTSLSSSGWLLRPPSGRLGSRHQP